MIIFDSVQFFSDDYNNNNNNNNRKVPVKFYRYFPSISGSVFLFVQNVMKSAEVVQRISKKTKNCRQPQSRTKYFVVLVFSIKSRSGLQVQKLARSSTLWSCNKTLRWQVHSRQAENKVSEG
jgi:hypothetical protein